MTGEDNIQLMSPVPPSSLSDSTATSSKKRKQMALLSALWGDYERFQTQDGIMMARCKFCRAELRADTSKNETSRLKSHSKACKERIEQADTSQSILALKPASDLSGNTITNIRCDPETIQKSLTKLIITSELPFRFVSRPEFIDFMSIVCPKFKVPSRWTIQRDCIDIFISEKEKLRKYFINSKQRVCLTTDTWTSLAQSDNYMCLTAHFIDENWVLHKRVINFCKVSSHRGKDIGLAIDKCLRDWGLESIFTITVDNASSNDVAVRFLKDKYCNKAGSVLRCDLIHVRCVAHIINLIVKDGLRLIFDSVKRVREIVNYIRGSYQRRVKFKECIEAENIESKCALVLDVPTRWNSTYLMLSTALKYEKAFARFDDENACLRSDLENEDGICMVPDSVDWDNVRRLVLLLKQFYELTLKVSASKFVTSNCFFHEMVTLDECLKEWEMSTDREMSSMAINMKLKYEKYWGNVEKMNMLMFISIIFDPRSKMEYLEFCLNDMYGDKANALIEKVKDTLNELFDDYKTRWVAEHGDDTIDSDLNYDQGNAKYLESDSVLHSDLRMFERLERFDKRKKDGRGGDDKSELQKYLTEDREVIKSNVKFDILAFWKVNVLRFPVVSQIARDILAMPISTVASESAFSTGGRILDSFRSSLGPRSVEALLCTQDWFRGLNIQEGVEEDPLEQEKFDEEMTALFTDSQSRGTCSTIFT